MDTNKPKITYLIGAGASYKTLPLQNDLPESLKAFVKEIRLNHIRMVRDGNFPGIQRSIKALQKELMESLNYIVNETDEITSVDQLALRMVNTKQFPELLKLKAALICYFIFRQINQPVHKRYVNFFNSIIRTVDLIPKLPDNLKVLSWNYDFQFEKAFSIYSKSNNLHENQVFLNIRPSNISDMMDINGFSIFKLNGTAASVIDTKNKIIENLVENVNDQIDNDFIEGLIRVYANISQGLNDIRPLLTFAWEEDSISKTLIRESILSTKETKVLVIIGYSFPEFNGNIDRKILRSMKDLVKVYIQVPSKYSDIIKSKFLDIRKDFPETNIVVVDSAGNFILPPELLFD